MFLIFLIDFDGANGFKREGDLFENLFRFQANPKVVKQEDFFALEPSFRAEKLLTTV